MKSKRLPLWLGAIGILLLVPGTLWVIGSRNRLHDDDARVSLRPLERIQLDRIGQRPILVTFMIPNTTQWTRIRNGWGEPELVISVVDTADRFALCLSEMPIRIELMDPRGKLIPLQPDGAPYGYSTTCASSGLRFHAAPGKELTLKLARTSQGTLPAGDLIVVSDWFNTKDKLVGLYLDKDIGSLIKWLSIIGSFLVVSAAGIFFVSCHRHHAVNQPPATGPLT